MRSEIDKSNMYDVISKFSKQAEEAWKNAPELKFKFKRLLISGLGGSAIAGDILACCIPSFPISVSRAYSIPSYVDRETLVVVNSYSGNTEETLSAYKDAVKKKAKIVVLTSGGKLLELAKKNKHPIVMLPAGLQPRASLMYSLMPLLKLIKTNNIAKGIEKDVKEAITVLKQDSLREKGEELAEEIGSKIPLIYASHSLYGVAMRCKSQINENAKTHAFWHAFPEMNHNELVGFTTNSEKYSVLFLRTKNDHERIQKRYDIFKDLVSSDIHEAWAVGKGRIAQILSLVHIGDWLSYYSAIMHNIDPTPVDVIQSLKKKLLQ
jgi:glucose/mannose-6-phosphate isomerase